MKTIAITGAAGLVGTGAAQGIAAALAPAVAGREAHRSRYANERSAVVGITDQASLTRALRGCDAVVHLAACTTDAPWPEHVKLSIEGSISLFDAAREAGVTRVVYASSHHVVGLYPRVPNGPRLGTAVQVRPDSRYAVGKAFGESICAMYAGKYGMQVLAIRIGNVNTRPIDRRRMGNWLSLARPGATGGAGH